MLYSSCLLVMANLNASTSTYLERRDMYYDLPYVIFYTYYSFSQYTHHTPQVCLQMHTNTTSSHLP